MWIINADPDPVNSDIDRMRVANTRRHKLGDDQRTPMAPVANDAREFVV
jgi:hypothetical protein